MQDHLKSLGDVWLTQIVSSKEWKHPQGSRRMSFAEFIILLASVDDLWMIHLSLEIKILDMHFYS